MEDPNQDSQTSRQQPSRKGVKQVHRPHQKRIHRDPSLRKRPLPPVELIPKAEEILVRIDMHRFLTHGQIGELLFRRTRTRFGVMRSEQRYQKTANQAIGDLMDHGLIEGMRIYQTHPRTGNEFQAVALILSPAGRRRVAGIYDRYDDGEAPRAALDLKQFTSRKVDHELGVTDAMIALSRSVWQLGDGFDVLDWYDDSLLERRKQVTRFFDFTPDGWCVVETPTGRLCPLFVEIDRGTESIHSRTGSTKDWYTKIVRYGDYLANRYLDDPFYAALEYDTRQMARPLVLTVTTSPERMDNMLRATREAGGRGAYWYTTRDRLYGGPDDVRAPFAPMRQAIWWRVGDTQPVSLVDHLSPPT